MSDLTITQLWFQRAVPTPSDKNRDVQMGCHLEEVVEMLETLNVFSAEGNGAEMLQEAKRALHELAEGLKKGVLTHLVADRKELLDALCDQQVTATGVGHMHGLNVPEGLNRVNASNFSKFDTDGMPIFDENGKIAKNKATYFKADLEGLY
jgi:predicted HAD superfamily Cof-like phosphohydrolase